VSNQLEILLRKAGRSLSHYQVAKFWKIPEELSRTPCDFMGHTTKGQAILIEAKQVNRTSLPLGKSPGLLPHQYTALDEANSAGAISIVCWARGDLCMSLAWAEVLDLSFGRKSIPWDHRYVCPCPIGRFDSHLRLLERWFPVHPA